MAPKKSRPKNNINRPWEPGELAILKLAENLNSEGVFWAEQFNKLSFWKDTDGNRTIVRRNKAGKLRLVRVDKKYAGRLNRLLVEEIPPQVQAIFKGMESAGTIPEGTYKQFVSWVNTGVRESFAGSRETTQRTGIDTEGGHLYELQGKRAGSGVDAPAHTGLTIIDEPRNPYINEEGILMPGNNPKKNDPGWHLDPKQMDAAGLPSTWGQLMNRFLTGKSGANVERISEERLRRVRDKETSLDQVIGEQDQENQRLAWEEGERYRLDGVDDVAESKPFRRKGPPPQGEVLTVNGRPPDPIQPTPRVTELGSRLGGLFSKVNVGGNLRRADTLAQLGISASQGDALGMTIQGTQLAAGEALQTRAVQTRLAKKIAELSAKRAGKTGLKLIPGVGLALSGAESYGYAQQGKWDQAIVSGVSGIVGELPGFGDALSASLDIWNTSQDISDLHSAAQQELDRLNSTKTFRN